MYAHYLVLEVEEQVVGYCGIWIVMDDAQITNIAVSPAYRGRRFGEALLKAAMKLCRMKRAVQLSLEVRVSNHIAQSLYKSSALSREEFAKIIIPIMGKMHY